MEPDEKTYTITLIIRNSPGVLVRCVQVLNRRGYTVKALQVIASKDEPNMSTMTITTFGRPSVVHQVMAQLAKVVDVSSVKEEQK